MIEGGVCLELFTYRDVETRWYTPENPNGQTGAGGQTNRGAKGSAFVSLEDGETKTLCDIAGSGVLRRIWMTLDDRSEAVLRGVWLQAFWDGAAAPAVHVPLGDFFCHGAGRMTAFRNALFASPEGRSFLCRVPMPFHSAARLCLCNRSGRRISRLFYECDCTREPVPQEALYFHADWNSVEVNPLGEDFTILPQVQGRGRFLGAVVSVTTHPALRDSWWGEGEVRIYLDDDEAAPTLVGTGTEDYLGTAWGQDVFTGPYEGCTCIGDGRAAFYRLHLPDPIYFRTGCRVTLQDIGGAVKPKVLEYLRRGLPIRVVSADVDGVLHRLLDSPEPLESLPDDAYLNFYRQDGFYAAAFYYNELG